MFSFSSNNLRSFFGSDGCNTIKNGSNREGIFMNRSHGELIFMNGSRWEFSVVNGSYANYSINRSYGSSAL